MTTFRSKVDGWLAAILVFSSVASLLSLIAVAMVESPRVALAISPLLMVGVVLPVWLLRTTEYRLDESHLHVRSGPFSWRVPLNEIRSITATRSALSSPALSLDRLRIQYGRWRMVMVSPLDKDAFMMELRKRMPAGTPQADANATPGGLHGQGAAFQRRGVPGSCRGSLAPGQTRRTG